MEGGVMQTSVFGRLGRFAVRRRWFVIGAWVVVAVVMGSFAGGLTARLGQGGFEVPGSDSLTVQHDLEMRFHGQYANTALVVVHQPNLTVDDASYRAVLRGIQDRVSAVLGVGSVTSTLTTDGPGFVSDDRHTTYIIAGLTGDQNDQLIAAGRVAAAAPKDVPRGFQVDTGGGAAFYNRFNEISRQDLERAEKVSFPITLVVLLVAFGTLVAAGLPIMLALVSLVVTLGALYFLASVTNMSVYVTNTASIIGIGVGIDYALFVVTRFREEIRRGRDVIDAVSRAVATSGRAVALSGATVIVALAGMFLVNIQAFRSMAIGSMAVVAVAVTAALTLLPAVLGVVGTRVDRLGLPRLLGGRRTTTSGSSAEGFWHRWALRVMRRPWVSLGVSLAILLTLALPFASIRLGQSGPRILPAGEGPRVASQLLGRAFGAGVTGPMEILIDTSVAAAVPGADPRARVERLGHALQDDPGVVAVIPSTNGGALVRLTVIGKDAPESDGAEALLHRVREGYIPAAGLADSARVGGITAFNVDLADNIASHLPLVVATVLALSFLLLVMAFRSIVLALKAVVMNLLSVAASYGLLVAVFQWGWGQSLLGFTSEGHLAVFVPLFLFSILFGLSMDYEVFLLTRIREEYQRTGSNELAVARGLESSARTITSAALIMVTVFAAFAASRLVPFKEMGFGLAAAVFVDATVVRTVLVPAAMRLMGRLNWWMPRWLDRALPRIHLEEDDERSGVDAPESGSDGRHPADPVPALSAEGAER
jgi:RND superfamily putative drug exporter